MQTVSDYIKFLTESEGAVNTVSSGSIAQKDVPLGKVQKRKDLKESDAYEGPNPLADNIGKFPLLNATTGQAGVEIEKGASPEDADEHKKHMFHLKQEYQQNYPS